MLFLSLLKKFTLGMVLPVMLFSCSIRPAATTQGSSGIQTSQEGSRSTLYPVSTATAFGDVQSIYPPPAEMPSTPSSGGTEGTGSSDICVPPGSPPLDIEIGYSEAEEAIRNFLNRGGGTDELETWLEEAGLASLPRAVRSADMTGDGMREIVVSIFNPESDAILPPGKLLILGCDKGNYVLAYRRSSAPGAGSPHLWYLEDLDGDNRAELVVSEATCGAHTCFEETQVLGWRGERFINRLKGSSSDLPSPDIRLMDGPEPGTLALEIAAAGVQSAGAGPQRALYRRWSLNRATGDWEVYEEIAGPSNYRIHILQDAEAAARSKDYETALQLYDRVVTDTNLQDWLDPVNEQAYLSAYALYKQAVIYTIQGRESLAMDVVREMERLYPPGRSQFRYLEMATIYREGFEEGGDQSGCQAAMNYVEQDLGSLLEPLGPGVFGYANPKIQPEDVCP